VGVLAAAGRVAPIGNGFAFCLEIGASVESVLRNTDIYAIYLFCTEAAILLSLQVFKEISCHISEAVGISKRMALLR
jgi:hypothetical protein